MRTLRNKKRSLCAAVAAAILWMVAPQEAVAQTFDYPVATQNIPSFPTACGSAKYATGGRGGRVITVNTLADDLKDPPVGSLRWALMQHISEPLTIVFNVSGHIHLKDELLVKRVAGLTIAGQSAPGNGVSISGDKISFKASTNVILRDICFLKGNYANNNLKGNTHKGYSGDTNILIDHCTTIASNERCKASDRATIYDNGMPRRPTWDTDGDGMPDYWEEINGFDKSNAEDGNYINAEGYTALEKYLCELMGEMIVGDFDSVSAMRIENSVQFVAYNDADHLFIEGDDELCSIHLFDRQGLCRLEQPINGSAKINIRALPMDVYILWVTDRNGYRNAMKLSK